MQRRLAAPLTALIVVLALLGCKRAPELAHDREQALALAAQYAPQLAAMLARVEALSARVKALPPGLAGADAVATSLDGHRATIGTLQLAVGQVPAKAAAAHKAGKRGELQALIAGTIEQVGGGLLQLDTDVSAAERAVVALDEQVKLAQPPPPPTAPAPAPKP